jgi:hypothetical protein
MRRCEAKTVFFGAKKELDPCLKHAGTVEMRKRKQKMTKKVLYLTITNLPNVANTAQSCIEG